MNKADTLIIGGGMAYTFLVAKGYGVGTSLVDESKVEYCKEMLKKAEEKGVEILLPIDTTVVKDFPNPIDAEVDVTVVPSNEIPDSSCPLKLTPNVPLLRLSHP